MNNRALLSALAVCCVVAGCDSRQPAEPPKPKASAAVVPLPPAAPAAPAASAGQDAKPMMQAAAKKPACKNGNNCTVELTVTGTTSANCKIAKSDVKLFVARGKPETIHWKIRNSPGANWDFDANGIDFSGDKLFSCTANGPNQYKCDDQNPEKTKTDHPYKIALKNGAIKCSNDPMIVNGADDENLQ